MTDITHATPADLPDILEMVQGLSAFHGDTADVTLGQLREIFFGTAPMGTALIAKQDGVAIGYAGLTPTMILHRGRVRIDIHHLFITEGHRATGIGSALIAKAKTIALAQNAERLTIGTDPDNAVSIAAYRAMPALTEISGMGPRFIVDLTP
jgi:GNAT superfamily N-acetyltransferase